MSEPLTDDRHRAIGDFLGRVHADIRRGLEVTLQELDRAIETGTPAGPGRALRTELAVHCVAVCDLLTHHHEHEDDAFGPLERHLPGLRPAIMRLREEHLMVSTSIATIRELVAAFEAGKRPAAEVRAEVGRLTADLERHFEYEESQLVPALNALGQQSA